MDDDVMNAIRKQFGYMLSLPERAVRSLAAVASGTSSLFTGTAIPDSLRQSQFYKVLIGDMQRFVSEKIAQVPPEPGTATAAVSDDFVQRKAVGGALETAGLLAMHMSPLWVFALAGDAAGGSNVFLNRLVSQLKENNVIAKDAQVTGLTDLLGAVQNASRKSASAVDTPPLSREDLSKLASEMNSSYREMFAKARDLTPKLDDLWNRLTQVAKRENISVERLSGMLAVDIADLGRRGLGATMAVGSTSADLIGEKILASYARTLDDMTKQGVSNYVAAQMKPFLQAAVEHFDPNRPSWTERKLGLTEREAPAAECTEPFPPPPPKDPVPPDASI